MLNLNSEFGQRVEKRLREEQVIWLTAVREDDVPQPNPVWFYFDGETILIYSQPTAHKVQHIQRHPIVALNFNTTEDGGNVVVIIGEARIDPTAPLAHEYAPYLEKYRQGIADINMTPEGMGQSYSTAIRITPRHMRGL